MAWRGRGPRDLRREGWFALDRTTAGLSQYLTERSKAHDRTGLFVRRHQPPWSRTATTLVDATGNGLNRLRTNGMMDSFAMPWIAE